MISYDTRLSFFFVERCLKGVGLVYGMIIKIRSFKATVQLVSKPHKYFNHLSLTFETD